jgi:Zn finger protein HypA/HybF involved in hydrogenase expression
MGNSMDINKAAWSTKDKNITLSMPIAKVDKERRIVSGFATLDNLDRQGDVVPAEASVKAFETFRGNIREMHQPKAVGKIVSFKEDKYFDQESKKFYNGVYVSAYVSKGAQDTWEKVLDGTLTGFSIGGEIHDSEKFYDEALGKSYQVIKEYSLSELSLVDNPANQFANVISIEKGQMTGYLSKALIENVFWCNSDDIIRLSDDSSSACPQCDKSMHNIGFVESNDSDKASMVKSMVSEAKKVHIQKGIEEGSYVSFAEGFGKVYQVILSGGARLSSEEIAHVAKSDDPVVIIKVYSQNEGIMIPSNRRVIKNISSLEKVNAISKSQVEEVSKMESNIIVVDEIEKSMSETAVEPAPQDAIPTKINDNTQSEVVGKASMVDEEGAAHEATEKPAEEEAEAEKGMANCKECGMACSPSDMKNGMCQKCYGMGKTDDSAEVAKSISEITATVASALSTLAETVKALDAKIEGINKSVAGLSTEVNEVKDSFGKRVDAVEKDTAFRKSADLGEILQEVPTIVEKSAWGGRFLTNADLF